MKKTRAKKFKVNVLSFTKFVLVVFCPGGFWLGGFLSGRFLLGGLCLEGFCPDTTTRVFQYKIFINILYLNKRLHRMELAESPLSGLCIFYPETISHLFCKCKVSSQLGKKFKENFILVWSFQILTSNSSCWNFV